MWLTLHGFLYGNLGSQVFAKGAFGNAIHTGFFMEIWVLKVFAEGAFRQCYTKIHIVYTNARVPSSFLNLQS